MLMGYLKMLQDNQEMLKDAWKYSNDAPRCSEMLEDSFEMLWGCSGDAQRCSWDT